jgi:HSP20 family protein
MANRPNVQSSQQQQGGQQRQSEQQQGLAREERRGGQLGRGRREFASPLGMLGRMMEDMDRIFGDFGFGRSQMLSPFRGGFTESMWSPNVEVMEKEGKLFVRADLPGLKPEDVNVNVENDVLTLRGERRNEHEEEKEGLYHCERSYGRFERSIGLPSGIDPNSIDARFENGVLEISAPLPKQEQRGRRIEVKGGGGGSTGTGERKSVSH